MPLFLLITAAVIFLCVLLNKISSKLGVPMLLAFIILGMVFGSDGIFKIPFSDFAVSEKLCTVALIFIMFYGGFGTKWSAAKPVAVQSFLLATVGVVLTAVFTAFFCYFVLRFSFNESFLLGAVISSTDAASVFYILRSKKLNLRYNTASLLEAESGSNDPLSYMLTIIALSFLGASGGGKGMSVPSLAYLIVSQLVYGAAFGLIAGKLAAVTLRKFKFADAGFDAAFVIALAVLSYSLPSLIGGNGYLSAYIAGLFLGNSNIPNKKSLVHFFDGITGLMQMLVFFLLGLLAFPSRIAGVVTVAMAVALFLTFVSRPLAVFFLLTPSRYPLRQQLLISLAGLRGAASIVFAVMALNSINANSPGILQHDLFHIVFFIVLFSITVQGSLLPLASKKLKMIDNNTNVLYTFNDYPDEIPVRFIQVTQPEDHPWNGKEIRSLILPPETLLVLILREKERLIPRGATVIKSGDTLVLAAKVFNKNVHNTENDEGLMEIPVGKDHEWVEKTLAEIASEKAFIVLIKRGGRLIIPKGSTKIAVGDILVAEQGLDR
ncbi:potassium/proton antiporter [Treponema parvum]|uniref:Potassium/proton antiporter n=1 Tax=Treponema parvum TaxID=138851 RepID=A0A975F084_9SPIR|nr:potassium/proton antiporter [Treponema parvum]QTQ12191.1 potassium/proton antiporter [Treponema parvum]